LAFDPNTHLAEVAVGNGAIRIHSDAKVGTRVRVQLLARDIILALRPPTGLSVRNALPGVIEKIERDDEYSDLVFVNIGDAIVISRVTRVATESLDLGVRSSVWVLVKAVSMRGHALFS